MASPQFLPEKIIQIHSAIGGSGMTSSSSLVALTNYGRVLRHIGVDRDYPTGWKDITPLDLRDKEAGSGNTS